MNDSSISVKIEDWFLRGLLYAAWSIPILNFVVNPGYNPPAWPVWFAIVVTLLLSLADRNILAFSIPFVALISPLASGSRVSGLLPSEIYVVFCYILVVVLFVDKYHIKLLPGDIYLLSLLFVVFLSYYLSFEYISLNKSVFNWLALIMVFVITRSVTTSTHMMPPYFQSIMVAGGFVSIIIARGFASGMSLSHFMEDYVDIYVDKENLEYLFRASFYYTNILYVLGAAAIASVVAIFTTNKIIYKLISIVILLALLAALFIMFAKTGIIALLVSMVMLVVALFIADTIPNKHRRIMRCVYILTAALSAGFLYYYITNMSEGYVFDTGSFNLRLSVYESTLNVLSQNPERLLFGFGPDSSTLLSGEIIESAKTSRSTIEGAIDSAYMTFLFEYGVIFVILFVIYCIHTIVRLFKNLKRNHEYQSVHITLLVVFTYVLVASISQVIGTSKVAWIVIQMFALSGICQSREKS
jgi:hypothetical protein